MLKGSRGFCSLTIWSGALYTVCGATGQMSSPHSNAMLINLPEVQLGETE